MSEPQYPDEYICPISRQLMINPVTIEHNNALFTFDKNNIEIWKNTENGDNNPLTNMPNFRNAPVNLNEGLKKKIMEFIELHNIEIEDEDESDYVSNINDENNILEEINNINNYNNNLFNYVLHNNIYNNNNITNFINNENQNFINQMNNSYNFGNNFTNNYLNQFEMNNSYNNINSTNHINYIQSIIQNY